MPEGHRVPHRCLPCPPRGLRHSRAGVPRLSCRGTGAAWGRLRAGGGLELLGGPIRAAHAGEAVRLQSGRPLWGAGPWDPRGCRAPKLERLEMGKIHSTETETIKGAEETHKEV